MRVGRLPVLFALLLASGASLPARAERAPADPDPRIAQAGALLEDEAGYQSAVLLYRAVLAERPEADEARLWLARVLAWQQRYDESLAEFERLLAAAPSTDIRVEYGEVLSWAGRSTEAERVLTKVLSEDPSHARAARGLARTYRWSGRRLDADRAYARALELEEDAEARAEWDDLRNDARPRAGTEGEWFGDSDDFGRGRFAVQGRVHLDFRTPLTVEIAYLHAEGRIADPITGARPLSDTEGSDASIALSRQLDDHWHLDVGFGRRQWYGARDHWRLHSRLEFSPDERTSLAVSGRFGDALEATDSYRVVTEGVRIGEATISLWRELTRGLEFYSAFSGGWLGSKNSRYNAVASLSLRPWQSHDFRIELSGSGLGYTDRSSLYYDPEIDVEGTLAAHYRSALPRNFAIDLTLSGGLGVTREGGASNTGPAFRVAAGLSRKTRDWLARLSASYARSQRGASYESARVTFAVARSF